MSKESRSELSDTERVKLQETLSAGASDQAEHIGYHLTDPNKLGSQCLVASMNACAGDVSVCGAKSVLIKELREFKTANNASKPIQCAAVAVLEITDSPVHVHEYTLEHYIILSGRGKLIIGADGEEQVVDVQEGSVALLPPGQPHGLVSDDSNIPVRALLTFTPGMVPKEEPEFRDEKIIHLRTSERLQEILNK